MINTEYPKRVNDGPRRSFTAKSVLMDEELTRRRGAIVGMERRLMSDGAIAEEMRDDTVIRDVLTRHYATYAHGVVNRLGGDVAGMHALTHRDNVVPLAQGSTGRGSMD